MNEENNVEFLEFLQSHLSQVAFTGQYEDLNNTPNLNTYIETKELNNIVYELNSKYGNYNEPVIQLNAVDYPYNIKNFGRESCIIENTTLIHDIFSWLGRKKNIVITCADNRKFNIISYYHNVDNNFRYVVLRHESPNYLDFILNDREYTDNEILSALDIKQETTIILLEDVKQNKVYVKNISKIKKDTLS